MHTEYFARRFYKVVIAPVVIIALSFASFIFFSPDVSAAQNQSSLSLDGSGNTYVSISDDNQTGLDITGDMTIMMWVKPVSNSGNQALLSKWNLGIKTAYILYLEDGDLGVHISENTSGDVYGTYRVPHGQAENTWYHVAMVYNASNGTTELFVNGVSIGKSTENVMPTSIANNNADFVIGGREDGVSNYNGKIDEVRIWSKALTSDKVAQFYAKPNNNQIGNDLEGYWKFNGDFEDRSANNNNLGSIFSTDVPF